MTERTTPPDLRVHCTFYTKTRAGDDGYHYRPVHLRGWEEGPLITFHPPAIGDLIWLHDSDTPSNRGTWRVTGRDWMHNDYGSPNWPHGEQHPIAGPLLTIIVVPAEGLFVDQVTEADEDEEAPDAGIGAK